MSRHWPTRHGSCLLRWESSDPGMNKAMPGYVSQNLVLRAEKGENANVNRSMKHIEFRIIEVTRRTTLIHLVEKGASTWRKKKSSASILALPIPSSRSWRA